MKRLYFIISILFIFGYYYLTEFKVITSFPFVLEIFFLSLFLLTTFFIVARNKKIALKTTIVYMILIAAIALIFILLF